MKNIILLILLVTAFSFSACYYDNEEELYPKDVSSDTTAVTYSGIIQPLVANNCAKSGCHVSGAQSPDLSAYTQLKNNIDRVKVRAIDQKTMPASGPLSNAHITQLQKWIDAGTPNN